MTSAGPGPARSRPFVIGVGAIRRHPGTSQAVGLRGSLAGLVHGGSRVPPDAEVSFEGTAVSFEGGVVLEGVVSFPFIGACGRCVEEVAGVISTNVRELCVDEPAGDLDYGVGADWLDVEPVVHDACILELPAAPLCRESCLGLCPMCGVNRNLETCSCVPPADPCWAGLAGLADEEADE